jgi:cytidylate kinase
MPIITISREMGTGAYKYATEVAKKLKFTLIDGVKIAELAPQYGLSAEILERVDEKPPVFRTADDRLNAAYLYTIELILLECARKGNVVIYGRGGQDILSGLDNVLRVRFAAPFEDRVESFAEREWIDPDLCRELIRKSDHQRGGFIHFYFDRDWNDPLGYDLVLNTSHMSPQAVIDTVVAAARDPRLIESSGYNKTLLDEKILCKKVETALLKDMDVKHPHLAITASGKDVAVDGHVQSEEEHASVINCIAKVEGVKEVRDNLHVISFKSYKR